MNMTLILLKILIAAALALFMLFGLVMLCLNVVRLSYFATRSKGRALYIYDARKKEYR